MDDRRTSFPDGDYHTVAVKKFIHPPFFLQTDNPWNDYHRILGREEGSPVVISIKKNFKNKFQVYAIKQIKRVDKQMFRNLRNVLSHGNLATCFGAYYHEHDLFLVYEGLLTPLKYIAETPRGRLTWAEIAAIALGILNAISYIHNATSQAHGSISMDTILVSQEGHVKLANGMDIRLRSSAIKNFEQDTISLSIVLRDALEPSTAVLEPNTTILREPLKHKIDVQSILNTIKHSTPDHSRQLTQIIEAAKEHLLGAYVLVAREVGVRTVEVFPYHMEDPSSTQTRARQDFST